MNTGFRYHYPQEDGRPPEADAVCPVCGEVREDHTRIEWWACRQRARAAS